MRSLFKSNWLLLLAGVFDLAFLIIYFDVFGFNTPWLTAFSENFFPELIGIHITVIFVDRFIEKRKISEDHFREFENDIQNYVQYLINIKNSILLLVQIQEKYLQSEFCFIKKMELKIALDNAPRRYSFKYPDIEKGRMNRITKCSTDTKEILDKLRMLLETENPSKIELIYIKNQITRCIIHILQLRWTDKQIKRIKDKMNQSLTDEIELTE